MVKRFVSSQPLYLLAVKVSKQLLIKPLCISAQDTFVNKSSM